MEAPQGISQNCGDFLQASVTTWVSVLVVVPLEVVHIDYEQRKQRTPATAARPFGC